MVTRTVWVRMLARSLASAIRRIFPASMASSPKGGVEKPISTCPDMTCVKVAGTLPVATSFAAKPYCLLNEGQRRDVGARAVGRIGQRHGRRHVLEILLDRRVRSHEIVFRGAGRFA